MFSHMMVGSNDLERSKKFYDALFGKPAQDQDDKGRLSYGRRGAVFMVTTPIDGAAGDARQWLDDRLRVRQPGGGRRLARGRCRRWRHGDRGSARHSRRTRSARSTSPICAIPTATSCAGCTACPRNDARNVSEIKSHGGRQGVYRHASAATGTDMIFSVFVPPQADGGAKLPVLWYLSGLTCTHANVTEKGEYRAACAELGMIFVAPDTSPRGEGVPDDPEGAWDFGQGAGFYVDATEEPWVGHFSMWTYVTDELPALVAPSISRSTWTGRASPAIRWAAMAR